MRRRRRRKIIYLLKDKVVAIIWHVIIVMYSESLYGRILRLKINKIKFEIIQFQMDIKKWVQSFNPTNTYLYGDTEGFLTLLPPHSIASNRKYLSALTVHISFFGFRLIIKHIFAPHWFLWFHNFSRWYFATQQQ